MVGSLVSVVYCRILKMSQSVVVRSLFKLVVADRAQHHDVLQSIAVGFSCRKRAMQRASFINRPAAYLASVFGHFKAETLDLVAVAVAVSVEWLRVHRFPTHGYSPAKDFESVYHICCISQVVVLAEGVKPSRGPKHADCSTL